MASKDANTGEQHDRHAVTTYIRHQPLFHEHASLSKHSDLTIKSLKLIGLKPQQSRTRATLRLLASWDGRDAMFQLAQAIALLVFSLAPVRRKEMHILSEGVANARRMLVVGKWVNEGGARVEQAVNAVSQDDESDDASDDSSSFEGLEADRQKADEELRLSHEVHDFAQSSWSRAWRERVESASEYLMLAAEACELTALLGGSSVLWRVLGGKLAARQRKGLERIALILMLCGILIGLRSMELRRREGIQKLKASNSRLLRATDMLAAEADAETIFQADRMTAEEVLDLNKKDREDITRPSKEEHLLSEKMVFKQGDRHSDPLRRAERKVFIQRKKMQLLRLERASMRAELIFVIAELFWPRHDHTRLEAATSLFAALCHMSRLTKEARWR